MRKPSFAIVLALFLAACMFGRADAFIINQNYNFSTQDGANAGMMFNASVGNISACFHGSYDISHPSFLENYTDNMNVTPQGIAFVNYSDCVPWANNSVHFYPLDNFGSPIFNVSSGLVSVEVGLYAVIVDSYHYSVDRPVNLRIIDADSGYVYNQTNLSAVDLSIVFFNFTKISVSYNFSSPTGIRAVLTFDDFYNYYGDMDIAFYFDYFKVDSDSCASGWSCSGGYEYYQNSSCSIVLNSSCTPCGCGSSRCSPSNESWSCRNAFEAWHWNSTCQNDIQLLCDISCSGGTCIGEHLCSSDGDCSNYCDGSTLYYNPYCDLGSYTCGWHDSNNCTYGCNPYSNSCFANPPPEPLFGDEDLTTMTPSGYMTAMFNGVMGFVNGMGGSYLALVFMIMAALIVFLIVSTLGELAKDFVK